MKIIFKKIHITLINLRYIVIIMVLYGLSFELLLGLLEQIMLILLKQIIYIVIKFLGLKIKQVSEVVSVLKLWSFSVYSSFEVAYSTFTWKSKFILKFPQNL